VRVRLARRARGEHAAQRHQRRLGYIRRVDCVADLDEAKELADGHVGAARNPPRDLPPLALAKHFEHLDRALGEVARLLRRAVAAGRERERAQAQRAKVGADGDAREPRVERDEVLDCAAREHGRLGEHVRFAPHDGAKRGHEL